MKGKNMMPCKNTTNQKIMLRNVLLFFVGISLFGCATGRDTLKSEKTDKHFDEVLCEVNGTQMEKYEGSLWQENGPLNDLFMDAKARRVGDIVTISVVEASSASNEAGTNTSRIRGDATRCGD